MQKVKKNNNKGGQKTTSINELISEKIIMFRDNGKYGTANNYRSLLHFIEKNFGVLKATDCNAATVRQMKSIMSHLTSSTQSTYLSCLKSIWNYANYRGYTGKTEYPFQRHSFEIDKVKVPRVQRRTESYLSREDISKLYWHWFTIPTTNTFEISRKKYLGLFLFSYLGNGANVNDLLRLTYNADWWNTNGAVLSFIRHKTADKSPIKVRIPITKYLKPILDFIADAPQRNEPVLSKFLQGCALDDEENLLKKITYINNYATRRLRYECKVLGLREDVSMTFARHTFITVLNHCGCNFSLIEMAAGHVLPGVTGHYIGNAPIEKLFEMNENLIVEN